MKIYAIKDWESLYENNRTRDLKQMAWVPVPNRHDGDGYTTLVCREDGAAMLGCWVAILQVASKCDPRGMLVRHNPALGCGQSAPKCGESAGGCGEVPEPHTAASLARITRLPENLIAKALEVLENECKWLTSNIRQEGAFKTHLSAGKTHHADYGMEGNGMEQKVQTNREGSESFPTLTEVKAYASMHGVKPADAEQFFHHFEAMGWVDKNGNPIKRWQSKLMTWRASAQNDITATGTKPQRKPFISEIKAVLEAKRAQRQAVVNRGHEDALGFTAKNEVDRAEFKRLNKEIGQLMNKIAESEL